MEKTIHSGLSFCYLKSKLFRRLPKTEASGQLAPAGTPIVHPKVVKRTIAACASLHTPMSLERGAALTASPRRRNLTRSECGLEKL